MHIVFIPHPFHRLLALLAASFLTIAPSNASESRLSRLLHRQELGPVIPAPTPSIPAIFPAGFPPTEAALLRRDLEQMTDNLSALRSDGPISNDQLADAALFHKGLIWALRYETNLTAADQLLVRRAIARGRDRLQSLRSGAAPWTTRKGAVVRGFVSVVDGSIQPYGVLVPAGYDGTKPMRLDVVLHGSSKPVGLSELRFAARFDSDEAIAKPPPEQDFIEVHPLGRVENCYRWAGETDVFEAIEAVCRNYRIDRARVVLRGMSMGASGTWHLGLKHPDEFVALGPYCGYVDTHRFSETPVPGFIQVGALPAHQERGLHLLDSVDYAANAGVVPAIGAIGDQDVFFQAHVIMRQAMTAEGLEMVNLISPGTGHVIDPATHREQMRRIGEYAQAGLDPAPRQLRFVTWTLKYNQCHWLEVLGLKQAYARSEFVARFKNDGVLEIDEPRNITRFALHPPAFQGRAQAQLTIGGKPMPVPRPRVGEDPRPLVFALESQRWKCLGAPSPRASRAPPPGLQGPIDDAFTAPFVCVRGTGSPWNAESQAWAEASLRRFQYEWARYMRGDLPVLDDTQLSETDVHTKNLILFGDPGSNRWIRRTLPGLPVKWTRTEFRMGDRAWSARSHAPVLIAPNPLPEGRDHYVVLNSGHTFHEAEFATFNYLLFPRLGDWAVAKFAPGSGSWQPGGPAFPEEFVRAGFLDEL